MERLLSLSKELSQKVESNDAAASDLLHQCEELQQKVKSMIQYQNVVQEISGGEDHPRGPPRIEFSYIRQLQQDNTELRSLLEEHEAALEMIMGKYREQMKAFLEAKKLENSIGQEDHSEEVRARTDEMYHMATIMHQAAKAEDNTLRSLEERLAQLEYENKYLREVLSLSSQASSSSSEGLVTQSASPDKTGDRIQNSNNTTRDIADEASISSSDSDRDSRSSTPRNE